MGISAMIQLVVPAIPPSPNRWNGHHWSVYRKSRQLWNRHIGWALAEAGHTPQRWPRSRVRIVRQSARTLDKDNAYASCKPVIDALRSNWLILDDSPDHLELTVEQRVGRPSMTEITVEELT